MAIVISGTTGIDAGSLPVSNCGNTEVEGNLGVGTNSPWSKLHTNSGSEATGVVVQSTTSGSSIGFVDNTSTNWYSNTIGAVGNNLIFKTATSERMRIDTAGNVGIGKTPATHKLEVAGNIGFGSSGVGMIFSDNNWGCLIKADKEGNAADIGFQDASGTTRFIIDPNGYSLHVSPTGLGYGTGAGGTVTQLTSKSTAVTLNKPSGQIVMNNAALAAGAIAEFQFSNTLISATDTLILNCNGFVSYRLEVRNILGGTAIIRVTNISGGNLSEALIINFNLIKGAQS